MNHTALFAGVRGKLMNCLRGRSVLKLRVETNSMVLYKVYDSIENCYADLAFLEDWRVLVTKRWALDTRNDKRLVKPGIDHVITRRCQLEGGTRVSWLTMANSHTSTTHICCLLINDRSKITCFGYYTKVCELHLLSLQAGSPLSHARERLRAKRYGRKESGEEVSRKYSNVLVRLKWACLQAARPLRFNFNTQITGAAVRDSIPLEFFDVACWNQYPFLYYYSALCNAHLKTVWLTPAH